MSDLWGEQEQIVGRWDAEAGRLIATGWTWGPAGPASVALTPQVTFAVDYANPQLTSEVLIEVDGDPQELDPEDERVVRAVLGSPAYERLLELAMSAALAQPRRISDESQRRWSTPPTRRRALGRFVLLAETAGDPDLSMQQAALAGLEAAAVASAADPGLSLLLPAARELATVAASDLIELADDDALEIDSPELAHELAAAIRRSARLLDDGIVRRRLRRLSEQVEQGRFGGAQRFALLATPDLLAAPSAARPPRATPSAPPVAVDGPAEATAHQVSPTEIEVYGGTAGDRHWARVFRRRDQLLLALAPLRPRRGGHQALLVIPNGFVPEELLVDITDEPDAARPSQQLITVRHAVSAGREACRLERLGEEGEALGRWAESADAWAAAGDPDRAETARRYSGGEREEFRTGPRRRRREPPQEPFLADRTR